MPLSLNHLSDKKSNKTYIVQLKDFLDQSFATTSLTTDQQLNRAKRIANDIEYELNRKKPKSNISLPKQSLIIQYITPELSKAPSLIKVNKLNTILLTETKNVIETLYNRLAPNANNFDINLAISQQPVLTKNIPTIKMSANQSIILGLMLEQIIKEPIPKFYAITNKIASIDTSPKNNLRIFESTDILHQVPLFKKSLSENISPVFRFSNITLNHALLNMNQFISWSMLII